MRRLDLSAVACLCLGLLSGLPALADGGVTTGKLSHSVEIPSHRWLAGIREAPDTELAPFTTDGCSGGSGPRCPPGYAAAGDSHPHFILRHAWSEVLLAQFGCALGQSVQSGALDHQPVLERLGGKVESFEKTAAIQRDCVLENRRRTLSDSLLDLLDIDLEGAGDPGYLPAFGNQDLHAERLSRCEPCLKATEQP